MLKKRILNRSYFFANEQNAARSGQVCSKQVEVHVLQSNGRAADLLSKKSLKSSFSLKALQPDRRAAMQAVSGQDRVGRGLLVEAPRRARAFVS